MKDIKHCVKSIHTIQLFLSFFQIPYSQQVCVCMYRKLLVAGKLSTSILFARSTAHLHFTQIKCFSSLNGQLPYFVVTNRFVYFHHFRGNNLREGNDLKLSANFRNMLSFLWNFNSSTLVSFMSLWCVKSNLPIFSHG